jgi:putative peptidoglycan lipid II flippase
VDPSPADAGRPSGAGRAIARAGIIVSTAYLAARVLGYVRTVVIATTFGLSADLDAFYAAFRIPDLIFQLVAAGALSSALVPVLSGLLATGERARAWRVVSTIANLMIVGLAVLAIGLFVLAPVLVPLYTPGFDPAEVATTVELTRIMLLSPIFLALGAVATSVLNSSGRFGAAAAAPIVYNIVIIIGALILPQWLGIAGLAVAVVAGSAGHLLVQLPLVRRLGARLAARIDTGDAAARTVLRLMVPRALGLGGVQITFIVMTMLASTLPAGSVSGFNFAFVVLQIPIGVIGVPLGIVLLPSLSREIALGDVERYRGLVARALRLLAVVMIGIAAVGFVLADEIVVLLFGYGAVDPATLGPTGMALATFLLGLPAHALIAVLARAFYARQDTLTPVLAALGAVAINIVVGLAAVGPFGLPGLALAIAIGAWIEAGALAIVLTRRTPGFALGGLLGVLGRAAVAGAGAAVVTFGLEQATGNLWGTSLDDRPVVLARALVASAGGLLTYVVLALALRIREVPSIVAVMLDLLRRPRTS